jgi:hypothetical protein
MALPATDYLKPPLNEAPINQATGMHTEAWIGHNQDVADAITRLKAKLGVTDGSDAAAGQVGELLTASGGPIGLTTNVAANIASLPLPAGDFEVWGNIHFAASGTTHPTQCAASISTVSGANGPWPTLIGATFNTGANINMAAGQTRVSGAAGSTVYLVGSGIFTGGAMPASGQIWARRVR